MEHKGTQALKTARLLLRPFRMSDAAAMFKNWASDPEVTRFLTWPPHTGADISRWVLSEWIGSYARADWYQWAVVPRALEEPIGSISVVRMDEAVGSCDLGWCIGKAWWGQGFMPEAGAAVLRFLFEEVKANRVVGVHALDNPKSGRVMQKLGMVREGVLRQAGISNHGIQDDVVYSMLAEEYRGGMREQLIQRYGLILN